MAEIEPLPGYEWGDKDNMAGSQENRRYFDWMVDYRYTSCDEDGWSYGVDFGMLSQNYRNGYNCSSPTRCWVRRRKWSRLMVKISEYSEKKKEQSSKSNSNMIQKSSSSHNISKLPEFVRPLIVEVTPGNFEYEIFENQRFSPFFWSWGSSWPGHLLPTDRDQYGNQDGTVPVLTIGDVRPPPGCVWGRADDDPGAFTPGWVIDSAYIKCDHEGFL